MMVDPVVTEEVFDMDMLNVEDMWNSMRSLAAVAGKTPENAIPVSASARRNSASASAKAVGSPLW